MNKSKILSAFMAGAMAFCALPSAVFTSSAASSKEGKVLNIYCWNEEFKGLYEEYCSDLGQKAGVTVNWIINQSYDGVYQDRLDHALINQDTADADHKVDIFLVEPDYSDKYTDSGYVLPVSELGLTAKDMQYQYSYTKDIVTYNGEVMGVTWNMCSGVFVYRRDIAKEVLGTDDPAKVQKYVKNWSNFDKTAAKMKKKGYYMLAGYSDSYRLFYDNITSPLVKNGKINIDKSISQWLTHARKYYSKAYNAMADIWTDQWAAQMSENGSSFGFFMPQWGVEYVMPFSASDGELSGGLYGQYAVCEGPAPYFWGGTWICGAKGTDNPALVGQIMKRVTCNSSTMSRMAAEENIPVNNMAVMKKLAKDSSFKSDFLGGQNPYAIYHKAGLKVDGTKFTYYDLLLNELFCYNMRDYIMGDTDKKTALNNFYSQAFSYYPELKTK